MTFRVSTAMVKQVAAAVRLSATLFAATGCGNQDQESAKEHGRRVFRELKRLDNEIQNGMTVAQDLGATDPWKGCRFFSTYVRHKVDRIEEVGEEFLGLPDELDKPEFRDTAEFRNLESALATIRTQFEKIESNCKLLEN